MHVMQILSEQTAQLLKIAKQLSLKHEIESSDIINP